MEKLDKIVYIKELPNTKASTSEFNTKTNTISWASRVGLYTNKYIFLSPTVILNHEADHSLEAIINPKKLLTNYKHKIKKYDNKEEERVIKGSEQRTAKALKEIKMNEITRNNHRGNSTITVNSTSSSTITEVVILRHK